MTARSGLPWTVRDGDGAAATQSTTVPVGGKCSELVTPPVTVRTYATHSRCKVRYGADLGPALAVPVQTLGAAPCKVPRCSPSPCVLWPLSRTGMDPWNAACGGPPLQRRRWVRRDLTHVHTYTLTHNNYAYRLYISARRGCIEIPGLDVRQSSSRTLVRAVLAINRLGLSTASRAYELFMWP